MVEDEARDKITNGKDKYGKRKEEKKKEAVMMMISRKPREVP